MLITAVACLRIQHDLESELIRYQWQAGSSMTDFRPALTQVLELVRQEEVRYCLLDLHGLPDVSAEDQFWLSIHWLPRVVSQHVRQVALVFPNSNQYNQMVVEGLLSVGRPLISFELQFFADAVAALDWLVQAPELVVRLEQEWCAAG